MLSLSFLLALCATCFTLVQAVSTSDLVSRADSPLGTFWVYANVTKRHTYETPFVCNQGESIASLTGKNWIAFSNETLQTIWVSQDKLGIPGCQNFTVTPSSGSNLAWDGLKNARTTCAAPKSATAYALIMCANCAADEAVISYGTRQDLGCGSAMGSISSFSVDVTYAAGVAGIKAQ